MSKFIQLFTEVMCALLICVVVCILHNTFVYAQVSVTAQETEIRDVIHFGIYERVLLEADTKNIRAAVEYWIKKLGLSVNLRVEGKIYMNKDSLLTDFKNGKLDYVHMSPGDYLNVKSEIEGDLGPLPVQGGKKFRNYQVILRSNSPTAGIADLKDKILAIVKDDEGGRLYLNTLLLENRMEEIEGNFSRIIEARTFGQAILAVFFGRADVCVASDFSFDTVAELNPQVKNKLKVLMTSPGMCHTVSLYRKSLDDHIKEVLTDYMCNFLDKSPEGDQVKILFMIEGMVPGNESDIESYRQLYQKYLALKSGVIEAAEDSGSSR